MRVDNLKQKLNQNKNIGIKHILSISSYRNCHKYILYKKNKYKLIAILKQNSPHNLYCI